MATPTGSTTPPRADYVDLTTHLVPVPSGWSNKRGDLNIDLYFEQGCVIPDTLGIQYSMVRPIITDGQDTYFFEAETKGAKPVFLWNAISGRLFIIEASQSLKEIMNMVDISLLSINMSLFSRST